MIIFDHQAMFRSWIQADDVDTHVITVLVHVFFFSGRHWGAVVNLTDWWAAPVLLYSEGYPLVERGVRTVLHL